MSSVFPLTFFTLGGLMNSGLNIQLTLSGVFMHLVCITNCHSDVSNHNTWIYINAGLHCFNPYVRDMSASHSSIMTHLPSLRKKNV